MSSPHTRHFSQYICHVVATFRLGGIEYTSEFSTEFICAFCQKNLEACIRIGQFLPFPSSRWKYKIEFTHLGYVDAADPKYRNFIKYTNYDGIIAQLIRALIWDISVTNICFYGEEEINKRVERLRSARP